MSQLVVGVAAAIFVLTTSVVGARLLWLAWRSRQLPEFTIGAGLFSVAAVGFPLMGGSGVGQGAVSGVDVPILMAGFIAVGFGVVCLYAFTWSAFRREAMWARAIVASAALLLGVVGAGTMNAFSVADPAADSLTAATGWMAWLRVAIIGAYLWTGIESGIQWTMARRRQALGLSDPLVTNRLLLWSMTGAFEAVVNTLDLVLHLYGLSPVSDGRAMAVTAVGGVVASAMMYLTFLPPAAYVRWVTGSSAGGALERA